MPFKLNQQTSLWKPSETLGVIKQIAEIEKETGQKIIRLTAGQPHFKPSEDIINALSEGGKINKYEPVSGHLPLREAIAEKFSNETGNKYIFENVFVSVGGKEALYHIFGALTVPGDIYLLPVPYWVSIPTQIESFGGVCVSVKTNDEFKITRDFLNDAVIEANNIIKMRGKAEHFDKKGKIIALYLNSPCNPTGTTYTIDELREIAEALKENNIGVISDEVYKSITFDNLGIAPSISSIKGMADRTIISSSISKELCAPGYRVGWAVAPKEIIGGMDKRQSDISSGTSAPAQYAAMIGLKSEKAKRHTANMVKYYEENRDYFAVALLDIELNDGKKIFEICGIPQGAFYLFPDISNIFGYKYDFKGKTFTIKNSEDAQLFFMRFGVAGINGKAFGMDKNIRLSYAIERESLEEAIVRFQNAAQKLYR